MGEYEVSKTFPWQGRITEKVAAVMRMFGLTAETLREKAVCHYCRLHIGTGEIVYISGPSGAGKSVLLEGLQRAVPAEQRVNLTEIPLPADKAVVDCITGDVIGSLRTLSRAGLNDCLCVLTPPAHLSEGQKWRFRLAAAMATGKRFVFADEFCAHLDAVTAAVISYNLRRYAWAGNVTFILAGCREDFLADLQPDVLVLKQLSGPAKVIYKHPKAHQ